MLGSRLSPHVSDDSPNGVAKRSPEHPDPSERCSPGSSPTAWCRLPCGVASGQSHLVLRPSPRVSARKPRTGRSPVQSRKHPRPLRPRSRTWFADMRVRPSPPRYPARLGEDPEATAKIVETARLIHLPNGVGERSPMSLQLLPWPQTGRAPTAVRHHRYRHVGLPWARRQKAWFATGKRLWGPCWGPKGHQPRHPIGSTDYVRAFLHSTCRKVGR